MEVLHVANSCGTRVDGCGDRVACVGCGRATPADDASASAVASDAAAAADAGASTDTTCDSAAADASAKRNGWHPDAAAPVPPCAPPDMSTSISLLDRMQRILNGAEKDDMGKVSIDRSSIDELR